LKNNGNVPLNFNLCLRSECRSISLGILDQKEETFSYTLSLYKGDKLSVTAKDDSLDVESILVFGAYEKPVVNVLDIKSPEIDYDGRGEIELNLEIVPYVNNLEIDSALGTLSLSEIGGKQKIIIPFNGWDLNEGENVVSFIIKYKNNGDEYTINKDIKININKVNSLRKFLVLFKRLY